MGICKAALLLIMAIGATSWSAANVDWRQAGLDAESYKQEVDRRKKRRRFRVRRNAMGSDRDLRGQWLKNHPMYRMIGLAA